MVSLPWAPQICVGFFYYYYYYFSILIAFVVLLQSVGCPSWVLENSLSIQTLLLHALYAHPLLLFCDSNYMAAGLALRPMCVCSSLDGLSDLFPSSLILSTAASNLLLKWSTKFFHLFLFLEIFRFFLLNLILWWNYPSFQFFSCLL